MHPPRPRVPTCMRYIGNKTRLLPFILGTLRRLNIAPGSAHDAFAGTAAVGRALKAAGWRVASSDLMTYSYVFQRAYVVARRSPSLVALRAGDVDVRRALRSPALCDEPPLRALGTYLATCVEPEHGFVTEHFSPAGGRMYFTEANARRIDAARHALHRWHGAGLIGDDAFYILLAALIEGADRAANTAGVYAAFIKRWQPNAARPVSLVPEMPTAGPAGASAHRGDATEVASRIGALDLLYVDPPYNSRQYAGYYHVPELIARGWFDERPVLRGKTGLIAHHAERSAWCATRRVAPAFAALLGAT
ncbi:MAG: DNA adenine methylase, partial [Gemmatimonadaceae bacterium]